MSEQIRQLGNMNYWPKLIMLTQNIQITPNDPTKNLTSFLYDMNLLDYYDISRYPYSYDIYIQNVTVVVDSTKFLIPVKETKTYFVAQRVELNKLDRSARSSVNFNFKIYSDTMIITVSFTSFNDVLSQFGAFFSVFTLVFSLVASTYNDYFYKEELVNSIFKFTKYKRKIKKGFIGVDNDNIQTKLNEKVESPIIIKSNLKTGIRESQNTNELRLIDNNNNQKVVENSKDNVDFSSNRPLDVGIPPDDKKKNSRNNLQIDEIPDDINNPSVQLKDAKDTSIRKNSESVRSSGSKIVQNNNYAVESKPSSLRSSNQNFFKKKSILQEDDQIKIGIGKSNVVQEKIPEYMSVYDIITFALCFDSCINPKKKKLFNRAYSIIENSLDIKTIIKKQFEITFLKRLLLDKEERRAIPFLIEDICIQEEDRALNYLEELEDDDFDLDKLTNVNIDQVLSTITGKKNEDYVKNKIENHRGNFLNNKNNFVDKEDD